MSCVAIERLAAAAAGEDDEATAHAAGCAACGVALAHEVTGRVMLATAPPLGMSSARRAALRAELLARSDAELPLEAAPAPISPTVAAARRRRAWAWLAVPALAAGIVGAIALERGRGSATSTARPVGETGDVARGQSPGGRAATSPTDGTAASHGGATVATAGSGHAPATTASRSSLPPSIVVAETARFERHGDEVALADGTLTIDARDRQPTEVVIGAQRVTIAAAHAKVTVAHGRLVEIEVFAGSVELAAGGRTINVDRTWTEPVEPSKPAAPPKAHAATGPAAATATGPAAAPASGHAAATDPLAVDGFRLGWEAMHAGHLTDAIAAFDRATDPTVVEEARYWAAVAAARAGDRDGSDRRLRAFLAAYPTSTHVAAAQAALAAPR